MSEFFSLWAKTDQTKTSDLYHSLIFHLIDVSQTALCIWEHGLSEGARSKVSEYLNLEQRSAGRLNSFWAGLHDLGKASPSFQRKYEPLARELERQGFSFDRFGDSKTPHGVLTAYSLGDRKVGLLHQETPLSISDAMDIAYAVGGHHGSWPDAQALCAIKVMDLGEGLWEETRLNLFQALRQIIDPPSGFAFPNEVNQKHAFLTWLSGFTSVADWIGSMSEYFPYQSQETDLTRYAAFTYQQAHTALKELGWLTWSSSGEAKTFNDLFAHLKYLPNTTQQEVIDALEGVQPPALAILEAPTGIGKTEAALYMADQWLHKKKGRGVYIAMPTLATSNQMYDRFREFLTYRYPNVFITPLLMHSQAKWHDAKMPQNVNDEGEKPGASASNWFLPRKRGLLAPFAVGTVDQALLSILLTRHFFVRLFGLSHKVVIFDEVHAYDTYMTSLFERLLQWLKISDTSVIILSATLPEGKRKGLIEAYTGEKHDEIEGAAYPRLTLAADKDVWTIPLSPDSRMSTIALQHLPPEDQAILDCLREKTAEGGCVAVICNTVGRAQQTYRMIKEARIVEDGDLILFHARYPYAWRQETESKVLSLFGKKGERPHKAVVVATQVIEQSLDLDFDLMISEMAPVDLLIQRAGRLHRHDHLEYHKRERPKKLQQPTLYLIDPDMAGEKPSFGNSEFVYEPFILLASWLALGDRDWMFLPADTTDLIETVYSDRWRSLPMQEMLEAEYEKRNSKMAAEEYEAIIREIHPPDYKKLMQQQNPNLEEDNPAIHARFRAQTRLIDPGVSAICLHRVNGVLAMEPDGKSPVFLTGTPFEDEVKQLLQHTLEIHDRRVLYTLLTDAEYRLPSVWENVPAFNYHRLLVFQDGQCEVKGTEYGMSLSKEYGLEILKRTKNYE